MLNINVKLNVNLNATGNDLSTGNPVSVTPSSIGSITYTVTNGIGAMPAFDGTLTTEEIEAVAYYIFNSTNK